MRAVALSLLMTLGCAHNNPIDTICIRGQLSEAQAAAIIPAEYATWPTYCEGREDEHGHNGHADCQPRPHDRILVASCAEAIKDLQR